VILKIYRGVGGLGAEFGCGAASLKCIVETLSCEFRHICAYQGLEIGRERERERERERKREREREREREERERGERGERENLKIVILTGESVGPRIWFVIC
jgi:hypothetical protein